MEIARINRNNFLSPFFTDDFFNNIPWFRSNADWAAPATNIKEESDKYVLELATPGFTKEDIKIELKDNGIQISSEKKSESEESKDNYTRKEFSYQSFNRYFKLPDNVNAEAIEAKCENGVLTLTLPKKEVSEPASNSRKIEIN